MQNENVYVYINFYLKLHTSNLGVESQKCRELSLKNNTYNSHRNCMFRHTVQVQINLHTK